MQQPTPDSRRLAIDVLHHALTTRTAPEFIALGQFGGAHIDENDARFVKAMVLTSLRHLGQIDTLLAHYLENPLPLAKAWVQCALRIGVAQMRFDTVPAHAAVHATVEAVKRSKFKALSGMVNAVLKKTATHPELPPATTNLPTWLAQRLTAQYGTQAVTHMCEVASHQPAYDIYGVRGDAPEGVVALNANTLRTDSHDTLMRLIKHASPCFVQDVAASYPVAMLGDIRGKQVVEIGAAPGGKTMQMLLAGANVTAIDRSAARMKRLQENLDARGLSATCVVSDAQNYTPPHTPDIVLLDAPCSATGTWRKHPEVVHMVTEDSIAELATVQQRLMAHAWTWLKTGGKLLYIVCSLQEEEGEQQVAAFLSAHGDARLAEVNGYGILPEAFHANGTLRTHLAMMEDAGGMDGFFGAVIEKY